MANQRTSTSPPQSKRPRMEPEGEDCIVLEERGNEDCFIVNPETRTDKGLASVKNSQGSEFYMKGQYLMARNLYSEAIQFDPENAIYYANRAAASMSLNDLDKVLDDLDKAIQLDSNYLKAYTRKFNHLLSLGELVKAERIIEQIKRINFDQSQIKGEMQRMQERITIIRQNQSIYEKAVEKREHREALHYIEQILQICNHSQQVKLKKAEALACCLRHENVIEIVDPILRREATNSEALFIRGLSLYYQDNTEKAKAHFQQALKFEPEHRKSFEMLKKIKQFRELKEEAKSEVKNGNLNKAIELFKSALSVDPINSLANAKIHFNLSIVYRRQNKYDNAMSECSMAIELNPNYDKAYMKRGMLNEELHHYGESVADYERLYAKLKTKELKCALERAKLMLIRSKNMRKDYYSILGIPRTATKSEIKKAYRQKAMEYHPDRNVESDEKHRADQERMFKDVGESYHFLNDDDRRKQYDSNGHVENGDQIFSMFGPEVFKMFGCDPKVVDEFFKLKR